MSDFLLWIRGTVGSEHLPAWLQAFSAIVALGISVWAAMRATSISRRRERLELRGLAVAVYPEIAMLPSMVQNVRDGLQTLVVRDANLHGQAVAAAIQITATIQLPPMLDRNIDKLFILGELAGPSCLHLVRLISQYNSFVNDVAARAVMLSPQQWIEAVRQLEEHLSLLDKVCAKCEYEVKPFHDAIKG